MRAPRSPWQGKYWARTGSFTTQIGYIAPPQYTDGIGPTIGLVESIVLLIHSRRQIMSLISIHTGYCIEQKRPYHKTYSYFT